MSLNRRVFLAAILGGATVASALTAGHADAATVNEYRKLIDFQEKIILLTEKCHGEASLNKRDQILKSIFSESDDLIFYLTKEFDPTPDYSDANRMTVYKMFRAGVFFDTMSEDELREQERPVVSIAIIKTLLAIHRVPMKPKHMKSFPLFAERYKDLIVWRPDEA